MNFVDYLMIAVVVISLVFGFFRGFLRESVSLIAWLGGLWLAWHFGPRVEPHLGGLVAHPPASVWVARAIVLFGVLIVGWIVGSILSYFIHQSGVSLMLDRMMGTIFGFIRGVVLISVAVILGQLMQLNSTPWWSKSKLMPTAVEVSGWIKGFAETALSDIKERSEATAEA
jgi:membrane protein required for colicin V production